MAVIEREVVKAGQASIPETQPAVMRELAR